jgi:hypothetical protein
MRSNQEQDRQRTNARRARRHASISVEMLEGRQLLAIWSPWSGIGSTSRPTPDAPSSTPVVVSSSTSLPSGVGATNTGAAATSVTTTFTGNGGGSSSGGGTTFSIPTRFRFFNEVILPKPTRGTAATNPTPAVTPTNPRIVSPPKNSAPAPLPAAAPSPVSAALVHHATSDDHAAVHHATADHAAAAAGAHHVKR